MDLGVPVIARDSDGNLEIAQDEQNCVTYSFPEVSLHCPSCIDHSIGLRQDADY